MVTQESEDILLTQIEEDAYLRKFDSYRPKFKGLPEGYFPNTWENVWLIILTIIGVYVVLAGFFPKLFQYIVFLEFSFSFVHIRSAKL